MDWENLEDFFLCERRIATPDEIQEYLDETDFHKRIELAYAYQITRDDLYLEDLEYILADIDDTLHDFTD